MTYSERGQYVLRGVSSPFADGGQAVRAGGDRSSDGQDRGQAVPSLTRVAKVGDLCQMMTQIGQLTRAGIGVRAAQHGRNLAR